MAISTNMRKFERLRHIRYFTNSLQNLPKQYSSADTNRLTLVHFCVHSLDILGCLPDTDCCGKVDEEVYINRKAIIEWIYGLQTLPAIIVPAAAGLTTTTTTTTTTDADDTDVENQKHGCTSYKYIGGGFKGGAFLGPLPNASTTTTTMQQRHPYDHSHLAMTYVALCTLVALGDDLSRVRKDAILQTLQSLQKEDGSFVAVSSVRRYRGADDSATTTLTLIEEQTPIDDTTVEKDFDDDDCDLRFMYTAVVIWYLLSNQTNDSTEQQQQQQTINIESATSYIISCISYDGALALTPGREGHGGSTFCGIASLFLMGVLEEVMAREELAGWKENLLRWCVMRQYSLPRMDPNIATDEQANNGYMEGEMNIAAGLQGRPNKLEDTCYSYWIGGTLHLLSASHLLDGWALREYVLECQSPYGGFGKVLGAMPDLLHSFYSLAWLSLSNEQQCCSGEVRAICTSSVDDDDGYDDDNDGGNQVSDRRTCTNDGTISAELGSELQNQVIESMNQLSRLDCALGMCSKRVKEMWQLGSSTEI